MTNTSDIATPIHDSLIPVQDSPGTVDEWWGTPDADEVDGYDLLKDDALYQVVGLPFMATKAIFRDGIQQKGMDYRGDYVSLEIRVAPRSAWDLNRISSRRKSFNLGPDSPIAVPDEQLVINDGSTGLYRQIVQYLAAKELIILPEGPAEGEKGESIFDLPRSQWKFGAPNGTEGFEIKLRCSRGLRFSEYQSEYLPEGETARTWYIA